MIFASSGSEQGRESGHSTGSKIFAVVKVAEVYDPASGVKERLLMIKDLSEKLGRNDLCPCGSGRRF